MSFANALATISSMIQHSEMTYINPLEIDLKEQPTHCLHVETELEGKSWYFDIKKYLETGTYPENATSGQKRAICRKVNNC